MRYLILLFSALVGMAKPSNIKKFMNYSILLVVISIIFFSCKQKAANQVKQFPVIFDTIHPAYRYANSYFDDIYRKSSYYPIYYIGKTLDTFYLRHALTGYNYEDYSIREKDCTINTIDHKYIHYDIEYARYKICDSGNVEILIEDKIRDNQSRSVKITNLEKDTLLIGRRQNLYLIMEAMNNKREWQPIQEHQFIGCGTGVSRVILPPNECIITLAPIMHGNTKTKLRLRMSKNVSNEIEGYVHDKQFLPNYLQ